MYHDDPDLWRDAQNVPDGSEQYERERATCFSCLDDVGPEYDCSGCHYEPLRRALDKHMDVHEWNAHAFAAGIPTGGPF